MELTNSETTKLTHQEIFDKVYLGLQSQGWEQSVTPGGCKYRAGKLKCAAGWLIPNDIYTFNVEGYSVNVLPSDRLKKYFPMLDTPEKVIFVRELQDVHDNASKPEYMESRFNEYAKFNGLEIPTKETVNENL